MRSIKPCSLNHVLLNAGLIHFEMVSYNDGLTWAVLVHRGDAEFAEILMDFLCALGASAVSSKRQSSV